MIRRKVIGFVISSAIAISAVVSLPVSANAAETPTSSSSLETVSKVTAKAPKVLDSNAKFSVRQVISATYKLKGQAEPLVSAIAAVNSSRSVVAETKGASSLISVLKNGENTTKFKVTIPDGYKAEINTDGSIQLRSTQANIVIPFIKAPWAIDSKGKSLETNYVMADNVITQNVNTKGAIYPVVADPSIQWTPFPVIAMYGAQATAIARIVATSGVVTVGGTCVLAAVGGVYGKIFSAICSLVGLAAARDVFKNIASIWRSGNVVSPGSCVGVYITGAKGWRYMPARDCQ